MSNEGFRPVDIIDVVCGAIRASDEVMKDFRDATADQLMMASAAYMAFAAGKFEAANSLYPFAYVMPVDASNAPSSREAAHIGGGLWFAAMERFE